MLNWRNPLYIRSHPAEFVWKRQLEQTAGDLLPLAGHVLALYQHPRLYDGLTGELAYEWPDLNTGQADSSIVWDKAFPGPPGSPLTNHAAASR